jgi:integrase
LIYIRRNPQRGALSARLLCLRVLAASAGSLLVPLAAEDAGLSGVHFHDLRHTENALTAGAGASLRELMERMGHAGTRAALVCLYSTDERQRRTR